MVIGRLLGGRYEILDQVGGGGMSLVYRARDTYLNRIVAIKVLREQLTSDEEFVARFRREAQAVASLSHGNIVSIYDVGQEQGIYYLVMEMVEGRNLKEIIKERSRLPASEAVEIAKQICDALAHAHAQKIIHRDIKPHNIIITDEGKAKVTDFGIARAVSTATVTHTGSIMGSVHYFSPEQARGEIADEKSDIYALGVLLYEMLTGELPFEGESPISVALKKIHDDPLPPRQINAEIGEAMEKVILHAMSRDPFKRYESVLLLKQDLISAQLYNKLAHDPVELDDTIKVPKFFRKKSRENKTAAPLKLWIWLLISLIVIGFIFGMYLASSVLARGEATVPDVVEMNVEEAAAVLEKLELTLKVTNSINHPTIEEGKIVSQLPEAEQTVKKKTTVEVEISKGPTMVKVPDVLNAPLLEAEAAITQVGLSVGETTRVYHEQIPSGEVVYQEPLADKEVVQGSAVNLIVSKGPEPIWIKMPLLTGSNLSQAKAILQNYNLVLGIVEPETNHEHTKDTVVRQDPGPESEILQGSVVNLVVSDGPGPISGQQTVSIQLTNSGTVKIVVDDEEGRNVVYENYHYQGDFIQRTVSYHGAGFIEVYVNNRMIERKEVG